MHSYFRLLIDSIMYVGQSLILLANSENAPRHTARRARYRGMAKTHLQHLLIAVAMNLVRVMVWLEGTPRATTRTSRVAALAVAG